MNSFENLQGFLSNKTLSGFHFLIIAFPGLWLRSNPGLGLANAFGVCGVEKTALCFGSGVIVCC
jgi:hypothetical protein